MKNLTGLVDFGKATIGKSLVIVYNSISQRDELKCNSKREYYKFVNPLTQPHCFCATLGGINNDIIVLHVLSTIEGSDITIC